MGSRRRKGATASSIFSIWTTLSAVASAINFTEITLPNIKTGDYGRMGFVGDFDSISLYQYAEQGTQTYFTNGSHAIITQLPNGELTTLAVADGNINDMCLFTMKDGTVAGVVVGGNFTTIGGIRANAIALLNPDTGLPVPLNGVSGTVNAVLCDQEANIVFVGGEFSAMNSSNAISWVGMSGWSELPFQGFNGPVESISRMPNGTIVYGGRFTSIHNETLLENTNRTNKITQQVVNLDSASSQITAELGSDLSGFSDPKNVICSDGSTDQAGSTFLFQDGVPGSWSADLAYTVYPTKLRLYNTHFEGRGLKTFRFVSRPNNGIMNLTSVDPVSNQRFYCDAWCPLSHDTNSTVPYQDFDFVNVIPTFAFRIEVIEWFGAGAGLNGIELFQDDIYAFADNSLNEPSCKDARGPSVSNIVGDWKSTAGPPLTDSKYLTANFANSDVGSASITFRPDIRISGNYQVLVYTPGCRQDDTCVERGQITVSGTFSSNETTQPTSSFFQTNEFDKYDVFFTGYVQANGGDHTVEITLTPNKDQNLVDLNVVASKIRFILLSPSNPSQAPSGKLMKRAGEGVLTVNGVFAYNPNVGINSIEQITAISMAATTLPENATINAVSVMDETVYIAGDFQTNGISNFLSISRDGAQPVALGGLNAPVIETFLTGKLIYLAGKFNDTADDSTPGLSHVAAYDIDTKKWSALGTGLDGTPLKIVALPMNISNSVETTYVFSGDFTKILASDSLPEVTVNGIAVWVPSKNEWLERLSDIHLEIQGFLSQRLDVPNSPPFFAGSLLFSKPGLAGGAGLYKESGRPIELRSLGIDISIPPVSQNVNKKRALDTSMGIQLNGVQAGAFYKRENGNVTVLGGRFSVGDIDNLAFIFGNDNNRVGGVPNNVLSGNNVVTSLLLTSSPDQLFIGGFINTTIGGALVGGMVVYDMVTNDFVMPQPQPLQATDGNETTVYTITQQPNGRQIYVGGSFTQVAGGFDCEGICVYDPQNFQYFATGFGFGGVAYASAWTDADTLVVGGALRLNDSDIHLATYKPSSRTWTIFPNATEIPGPVTTIFTPSGEESNIYIGGNSGGRPFILRWDGTKWIDLSVGLRDGSILEGIEVFELDGAHPENNLLSQSQILMASGNILLDSTPINSSAALFDGANWVPFVLTSNSDGSSGSLGAFVSESKHVFNEGAGKLAPGLVVLVSLAISLGLIFLIVVIGVIASYIRRRREGYVPAPTRVTPSPLPHDMTERVPPDQLFQGVGLASSTRGTPHI
ncbi:hypothetical protein H072_3038 [Dactylellina haptotyla CBS 200.50]|uniref:Uncharacterized protein n=1 Tax=Dactylellina haptotyla (strain CBS 200.50) TaxID=1284197 RepID=S8AJ91_DACHA|nr:hypothetical protein H072_3038 [Dactylellina haptotyla CBS 200.50]